MVLVVLNKISIFSCLVSVGKVGFSCATVSYRESLKAWVAVQSVMKADELTGLLQLIVTMVTLHVIFLKKARACHVDIIRMQVGLYYNNVELHLQFNMILI